MHAKRVTYTRPLQNFTNFDTNTLGFPCNDGVFQGVCRTRCKEKLFCNSLFWQLLALWRSSRPTFGKRRTLRSGPARTSTRSLQTRHGQRRRRLPRRGWANNNGAAGAAAWGKEAGSDSRAAAIRAEVAIQEAATPEAAVTRAAVVGIPAAVDILEVVVIQAVEAIRSAAARGDILTMILAEAACVR